MSSFSFSAPLIPTYAHPGAGSAKYTGEEANGRTTPQETHSQQPIPFGHALFSQKPSSNASQGVSTAPSRYTIPTGQALSLGTDDLRNHAQQTQQASYTRPVYFQSAAGRDRGVLVCGRENDTKYSILRHLIRSTWSMRQPSSFRGILCFTTDQGSFGAVTSVTQAAEEVDQEPEIIVLTVPWKVSELSGIFAGKAKNISVLPIKVHLKDVSLDHIAFLQSVYQPDWHLFRTQQEQPDSITYSTAPEQLQCFLSINEPHEVTASTDWVSWIRSLQTATDEVRSVLAEKGTGVPGAPLLLCVDLSGFDPTELALQHTLADIMTKAWLQHAKEPAAQSLVVCDNAHGYLAQNESPFSRTLANLVAPLPLSKTSAPEPTPHLVILSQSPVSLAPNVLDHLSYLIIHRFTAPRWLQALEKHYFLQPHVSQVSKTSGSTESGATPSLTSTIEQILDLEDGHILFCSKSHDQPHDSHPNRCDEAAGSPTNGHSRSVFGPIQRPAVKPATTPPPLGRQLMIISLDPVSIKTASPTRATGSAALYPPANLDHSAVKRSPQPTGREIGVYSSAQYGVIAPPPALSSAATEGGGYESWRPANETNLGTPASGYISLHSPPGVGLVGRSIPRASPSPFDAIVSPTPSSPEVTLHKGNTGSFTSTYLTPTLITSPTSPTSRSIYSAGTMFSPFSMARRSQEVIGTSQLGNSFSNSSSSISSHFFPTHGDGNGGSSPLLERYRPVTTSMSSTSEGQISKTDTDSGGGDFVDVGAMHDALPISNGRPHPQAGGTMSGGGATGSPGPSSSYGLAALGLKRSYAGVTAPTSDGTIQRRATAILLGSQPDMIGRMQTNGVSANESNSLHSSEGIDLTGPSSSPPPPPPIYPESFFWPLLDALEKARAQVSSPHNRAQCVRHSVVGQELPPSARARLGLTFKEYVAAAARQAVVVTGDSGDKAWIAMRDWRYPRPSSHVGQRVTNK